MEELKSIIENCVDENDKGLVSDILNIVNKIRELKDGTKTTIAKLIDYNPNKSFVEPLTQGKISRYVEKVCKQLNIRMERADDSIGGLAYFYKFIKC